MSTETTKQRSIVIVGAGVIGTTIAHVLSEDPQNKITIVARDMPEDLDSQAFASPWAGANWAPISENSARGLNWDKVTFNKLCSMIPTGLVVELPCRVFANVTEEVISKYKVWWKDVVHDFEEIPKDQLPSGYNYGLQYKTVSLRPAQYLPWIKEQLTSRGITFVKKYLRSIDEALAFSDSPNDCVIINATALGARSLIGVQDLEVYPIRGQTIVVDAPTVKEHIIDNSSHGTNSTYIIPRPDGTVILGGTFMPDVWDTSIDYDAAEGIMERCSRFVPGVSPKNGAKIIRHNVGLRPSRHGGPRVEIERIKLPLVDPLKASEGSDVPRDGPSELKVIHAYGLGPSGYQNSWGVAEDVAALLKEL